VKLRRQPVQSQVRKKWSNLRQSASVRYRVTLLFRSRFRKHGGGRRVLSVGNRKPGVEGE